MLLSLPTELVQLILRECDTTTFLQLTFSCRALLAAALSNRQLIEYQLSQVPGGITSDALENKYELGKSESPEPYEYEYDIEDEDLDGLHDLDESEEDEDEDEGEDEDSDGDGDGDEDEDEVPDEDEVQSEDERKLIPDLGSGLSTKALFGRLLQRAYRNLFGAEFHCQRKLISFEDKVLDTRASMLECNSAHGLSKLVFKDDQHVYDVVNGPGISDQVSSPANKFGTVEILFTGHGAHVTPDDIADGIYMLHRFKPFDDPDTDTSHPFVRHAMQSSSGGDIFLEFRPYYPSAWPIIYSFPEEKDYEPIAFASSREIDDDMEVDMLPNDKHGFAISWQHRQRADDHHVVLYNTRIGGDGDEDWIVDKDERLGLCCLFAPTLDAFG